MRISFIVPCRDKEQHVAATVRSVLAQSYSPMEIVLSDQGSEDATLAIIEDLAAGYDGPNTVRVLRCPELARRGMPGLNAHLNWLDTQIEGDIVIGCSADDLNHPDRTKHTVRAFEEFNPSYVNTVVHYCDPDGRNAGFTTIPDQRDRWLGVEETIRHQIGSCGSPAWARDLYQKHGPLVGYEQQDMILPMMALFERGIYFIDKPLHTYISHASLSNTGFQGQIKAARDEKHRAQLIEMNNFAHVRNWTSVLARWQREEGWLERLGSEPGSYDALMQKIGETAYAWGMMREALIMDGISSL
jgi:glycosyltransferase involved in cell wall biosynthesis